MKTYFTFLVLWPLTFKRHYGNTLRCPVFKREFALTQLIEHWVYLSLRY